MHFLSVWPEQPLVRDDRLVDPTHIPGFQIVPPDMQLVMSCHEEGAVNEHFKNLDCAVCNVVNIFEGEVRSICLAFAVLNANIVLGLSAIRTVEGFGSVEINSKFIGHVVVGWWAIEQLAFSWHCNKDISAVVESFDELGAVVSAERPLSHPNWILYLVDIGRSVQEGVNADTADCLAWVSEGRRVVSIKHNVFHVRGKEQFVPYFPLQNVGVRKYKLGLRSIVLNLLAHLSVKVKEHIER